jgi:hypothetical protein
VVAGVQVDDAWIQQVSPALHVLNAARFNDVVDRFHPEPANYCRWQQPRANALAEAETPCLMSDNPSRKHTFAV